MASYSVMQFYRVIVRFVCSFCFVWFYMLRYGFVPTCNNASSTCGHVTWPQVDAGRGGALLYAESPDGKNRPDGRLYGVIFCLYDVI